MSNEQKVDILNQLTFEFITIDSSKVVLYNNQALSLSRQIKYVKGQAVAFTYKGFTNIFLLNFLQPMSTCIEG